jgi:hypothetical protein
MTGLLGNGDNQISFVPLTSVSAGQTIFFTNEAWDNTANSGAGGLVDRTGLVTTGSTEDDSIIQYVATSGLSAYNQVIIGKTSGTTQINQLFGGSVAYVSGAGSTSASPWLVMNNTVKGNKVLAFTSTLSAPSTTNVTASNVTFLTAAIFGPDSWTTSGSPVNAYDTYLPPGLDSTTSADLSSLWNVSATFTGQAAGGQDNAVQSNPSSTLSGLVNPINWSGNISTKTNFRLNAPVSVTAPSAGNGGWNVNDSVEIFNFTPTFTSTATPTMTNTIAGSTNTATNTVTNTATNSATSTSTNTAANTSTSTATSTMTTTGTVTPLVTSTFTLTFTFTPTATVSSTSTNSATATVTNTVTNTVTSTYTNTAANTATASSTATATSSMTNTSTPTVTSTGSLTPQPTSTFTTTFTFTPTFTLTPTITATPIVTAQIVVSSSNQTIDLALPNGTGVQAPGGIFSAGTTITVMETGPSSAPPASNSFQTILGNIYTFDAANTGGSDDNFAASVTLVFPVTADILAKYSDQQLQVAYYNTSAGKWQTLDTIVDRAHSELKVATKHFSMWAITAQSFLSSTTAGGGNILAPVPANSGDSVCLYTNQTVQASTWSIYNVAGVHMATVSFSNGEGAQCWNTQGVGRGLYYVKLQLTFVGGNTATEWHKVVVK